MNDHRDLKMFTRAGRDLALWGIANKAVPLAVVTTWNDQRSEEDNVGRLRDVATPIRMELQERHVREALIAAGHENLPFEVKTTMVYGSDDRGPCGFIVLFCQQTPPDRGTALLHHACRRIVKKNNQPGHVAWDGYNAYLFGPDGKIVRGLPPHDGTVERVEEWCATIRPGFKVEGVFDRSMSYVQMRDHQTRPAQP